jgi:hypothetical protein
MAEVEGINDCYTVRSAVSKSAIGLDAQQQGFEIGTHDTDGVPLKRQETLLEQYSINSLTMFASAETRQKMTVTS